ncbi:MAG: hypothetical protein JO089_00440 [Alphaproteobacteria bacterium]|nr:hypothetical protein [Alphaproteobacteria bacterium]
MKRIIRFTLTFLGLLALPLFAQSAQARGGVFIGGVVAPAYYPAYPAYPPYPYAYSPRYVYAPGYVYPRYAYAYPAPVAYPAVYPPVIGASIRIR